MKRYKKYSSFHNRFISIMFPCKSPSVDSPGFGSPAVKLISTSLEASRILLKKKKESTY